MKKEADKKLMKKNLAAVDIFAADVMLYDADGNEIWPDGNVKVTFEGTGIDGGSSTVYHMKVPRMLRLKLRKPIIMK